MNCPYCQKELEEFISETYDCSDCKSTLMYNNDIFTVAAFSKCSGDSIIDIIVFNSDDAKKCTVIFLGDNKYDIKYTSDPIDFNHPVDEIEAKELVEKLFNMRAFI